MTMFQPAPELLVFLFVKKFVYLQLLAVLALLRVIVGRGIARWPALAALLLSLGGLATVFAPALGVNEGTLYVTAARLMAGQGGMSSLLVPSAVFLLCTLTPRARWRWIDGLHILMMLGLVGLWWYTS